MPTLFGAITAAASGLDAQRTRIEVAVSNLANAESTRGPNGEPYRRRDVVLQATPAESFAAELGRAAGAMGGAVGVQVADVVQDSEPFRRRYEPSHPDADADGFVATPNVDVPEEMVQVLGAARAYQANITAISLIRDTVQRALELGK
ncbi:MAG: flagellar basal body rod protein FlgC [Acidobacteria bacterium]|nr:flagellar basal body rod protein FlgC [Acidobacteriota bacterium]